jgi:ketosteroid isomerase-like protein
METKEMLIGAMLVRACAGCSTAPSGADTKTADTNPADTKPADTKAKDVGDIKALEDRFMAAFKAKDVNAIIYVHVPDESMVVFDSTPPPVRRGRGLSQRLGSLPAPYPGPIEADISDLDITMGGGKRVNGQWLIAHEHVSFPVDVMTGKANLSSKP